MSRTNGTVNERQTQSDAVMRQEARRVASSARKQAGLPGKKVAIVCDWLTGIGGAERVVLELHRMFPNAPIYTSQYNSKKINWFTDATVKTTWLQTMPKSLKKFLPVLRLWTFSTLRLKDYGIIISSSGADAKAVKTNKDQIHICYMHAPTHYYWSRFDDYVKNPGFPKGFNWLAKVALKVLIVPLRQWDYMAAQRPDFVITNSEHSKKQIKKYYNRHAAVVHPPVDTKRFAIPHEKHGIPNVRRGFVITGRQTPYKRIDLAVQACTKLNVPLIVIGNGPEHKRLRKMAGKTVTFLTKVTDRELPHYLQSAEAFLFPGIDDFGIAPVEALAAGTPVIAYKAGGALDYVTPKTGLFFTKQTAESLAAAIQEFQTKKYSHDGIKKAAEAFSIANFHTNLRKELRRVLL